MSRSRAKGTAAETGLVNFLRAHGWPHAERRALHGANDKGDVAGTPGVCWESKSAVRLDLPGWLRETETERVNAGADVGVLVVKTNGYSADRAGEWAAVLPLRVAVELLHLAGYGEVTVTQAVS